MSRRYGPRTRLAHLIAFVASSALVALGTWLGAPGTARATEGETDVSAAAGVTFLDARGKGVHVGAGGMIGARHGITDAFDLAAELSLFLQPSIGSTLYGAAGGFHYVVDVGRWRPHLGALAGVTDLSTTRCDGRASNLVEVEQTRPPLFACGDELLVTGILPIGVEWSPDAPIRVGFASRIAVMPFRDEVPDMLLHIALGGSFTWIFDPDPARR